MTLNRKIVVLLAAGISLYTIVGFVFHQFLILPSFLQLEEDEARKDMRRCLEALESQLERIDLLCFDWAAWDDTYEFIEAQGESYSDSNLIPESFVDNGINLIYFFRNDGSLVWGEFYDLDEGVPLPFPDFEARDWAGTHRLLNHRDRSSSVRGIVRTSRGLLLIASRPILPSEAEESEVVRGTLLMGRLIDGRVADAIREQTQVAVDILDAVEDAIPREARNLEPGEIRIVPDGSAFVQALSQVPDINGTDALVFHVTIPRTILARGKTAIRLDTLAVAIAGFLFLAALLVSLKWVVTDPLHALSGHLKGVRLAGGMDPVVESSRRDEIGDLAREFNTMLERLRKEEAELVAAEAALRVSEARMKTILATAPDAIITIDMDGRIESANESSTRLFQYGPTAFRGLNARELIAPARRESFGAELERCLNAGREFTYTADAESEGVRKDGTVFPIHLRMASMRLEGDLYLICALRDISGLKAMQERVARNQHLARIGEMGASVAHEIRNPLAGIKGALQILRGTEITGDEERDIVEASLDLVERIAHTVEQLLGYARPITPKSTLFPLYPLLESVSAAPPAGARVTIACAESLEVMADPRLFRQVLENIWRNACQALTQDGQLVWEAQVCEGAVQVTLTNDGTPISDADLPRVFGPFFTTRVDGSGLGLAVSLRIVEAHGGSMALRNAEGGRVTASVVVPMGE